jgi:hypothetical protein
MSVGSVGHLVAELQCSLSPLDLTSQCGRLAVTVTFTVAISVTIAVSISGKRKVVVIKPAHTETAPTAPSSATATGQDAQGLDRRCDPLPGPLGPLLRADSRLSGRAGGLSNPRPVLVSTLTVTVAEHRRPVPSIQPGHAARAPSATAGGDADPPWASTARAPARRLTGATQCPRSVSARAATQTMSSRSTRRACVLGTVHAQTAIDGVAPSQTMEPVVTSVQTSGAVQAGGLSRTAHPGCPSRPPAKCESERSSSLMREARAGLPKGSGIRTR